MFDVFYIGDNPALTERIPFAKQITGESQACADTKMYWLIEPNVEILDYDVLGYRPPEHDQQYVHVWKWDHNNYGGIKLLPAAQSAGIKEINRVVCRKRFDILHTKTPGKYFDRNPHATHVWCVDPEYKFSTDIDWAPDNFEPDFVHSFHLRGQLEHKYPALEGGIKLYPKQWKGADIKYHGFLDAAAEYPVLRVSDVNDYAQRDIYDDEYVWLIDRDHCVNPDTIDWAPSPFEDDMVHSFRMPYQLTDRYPYEMGGIRLVPRKWQGADIKIHLDCPVEDENYDVFYVDADDFGAETYAEYAQRSRTEWFWIVDRDLRFNGKLLYVPAEHEQEYIHVFKIPGHLEYRYPTDITEPGDNRCGGVRLMSKQFDTTKQKYQPDVVPVRYDIYRVSNPKDYAVYAKKARTKMFWLVDADYKVDQLNYVPDVDEQRYVLNFRIQDQLTHKYPEQEGGINLVPKNIKPSTPIKYKASAFAKKTQYPVIVVADPSAHTHAMADSWFVDREYRVEPQFDWAPSVFEINCVHVFHIAGQLKHKYTQAMGGVRWVPREWNGEIVVHEETLDAQVVPYPVQQVSDPTDYSTVTEDCWLVDADYQIDAAIDLVPWQNEQERHMVHTFHVADQLTHKYPEAMGGIHWVPSDWNGEYVVHEKPLAVASRSYPVYFVDDPTDYSAVTEDCWLVDAEYAVDGRIDLIPWQHSVEKHMVHVYHVPGQLTHKYPESMGGVHWVPKQWNGDYVIHEDTPIRSLRYPIFYVSDPTDYSQAKGECWLVDAEYQIDDNIEWIPNNFEREYVHTFHVPGQLQHKYPEAMGGVRWIPAKWQGAETKIHTESPLRSAQYEIYTDEETGRAQTTKEWFWVVDAGVDVIDGFDFGFVPEQWDAGKTHVWQKLNPVTQRQYDYSGVMLCPKVAQSKGRPKYIREPACVQKPYEIHRLDGTTPILEQLEKHDADCNLDMYWIVDPYVELEQDFDFGYYPTQWDKENVHVFATTTDTYTGVRLYPKGTFAEGHQYTAKMINENSFDKLKLINTVASTTKQWPVIHLDEFNRDKLLAAFAEYQADGVDFVWTVDPDVEPLESVINSGFVPEIVNTDRIHVWQRTNPHSNSTHGYGGLRLWPTGRDYSDLTSDAIRLNKLKRLQYVKEPGCAYKFYEVVFISYHEPTAEDSYNKLCERVKAHWVKDVEGIFEAHQEAARRVNSTMFWVVDADAELVEDFDFSYMPDVYDQEVVHVWAAKNPVTGHEYGYGGVKLFNTQQILDATSWGLDFTTGLSSRFKAMPEVSCVTRFNTDAFSTWRSAFRECVKLALKEDSESQVRLQSWLFPLPGIEFRAEAKAGAAAGREYALENAHKPMRLAKINDYEWLKEQYDEYQSQA